MIGKISNNIFDVSMSREISAGRFNHCSSVCKYRDGILMAWYAGSGECKDDQSVHILFMDKDNESQQFRVGGKTGNPIIFSVDDVAYIIYSKFEDSGAMLRLADRWKYCSNWIARIAYEDGNISLHDVELLTPPEVHILFRCNPIIHDSKIVLPAYDEMEGKGRLIYLDYPTLKKLQKNQWKKEVVPEIVSWGVPIGKGIIQPTIWVQKGYIHLLFRNFGNNKTYAQHASTPWTPWYDMFNKTYQEDVIMIQNSNVLNRNNSLHALTWSGGNTLIWNDTKRPGRNFLTIGDIHIQNSKTADMFSLHGCPKVVADPIQRLTTTSYGAYPSMCEDKNGALWFSYTNARKKIIINVWSKKHYKAAQRSGDRDRVRRGEDKLIRRRKVKPTVPTRIPRSA